jgi:hypothetical protein
MSPKKPNMYEVIYLNNIAVITRYLGIIFLNNYSKTYEEKVIPNVRSDC